MNDPSSIFEQHRQFYLQQLTRMNLASIPDKLGVTVRQQTITVPVFGQPIQVSSKRIDRPDGRPADYTTAVVVCRYLLQCPDAVPGQASWQSFRDFPDAAPLVGHFSTTVEQAIATHFTGRLEQLRNGAQRLGGQQPAMDLSYDLSAVIEALPRVPVLLAFNDSDEDFPAQCSVLFENRTHHYLDMECVAMLGSLLVKHLKTPAR